MAGYTKEMLVDALVSRYETVFKDAKDREKYVTMVTSHYDKVGKDAFRVSASLDAAAIREYKALKK